VTKHPQHPRDGLTVALVVEDELARAFAGLTDDALAHLVLIGMLSTRDAQAARKART